MPARSNPAPAPEPARPLLSLCLATYNRARYLDRYLGHHLSALETAGVDYELVVSDNCSTDGTPKLLADYAARFPRLRVSRKARNVGAHPNILTTLHQARGEVVVSIADDDLAIPHQLLAYVRRMAEDPDLVMIQAPWLITDETKGGEVIGKFYDFDAERRFARGDYGAALAFVMEHHVFPECWLMRRDALPSIAGATSRFAYSYFWMLANALGKGEVLFSPEPHIAATGVSEGGHVGHAEAMESWDVYRGGLEVMASYARQATPIGFPDAEALGGAISSFVFQRMAVAARLQAHAGQWSNAYQLLRRLHAYGAAPEIDFAPNDVAVLAAIETAILECSQLGASEVVVAEAIPDNVFTRMTPPEGVRVLRPGDAREPDARRAWCQVGAEPDPAMGEQDFVYDIVPAMDRFPLFPA